MKDERGVVSNVDTFAQWTQTDFNINIVLPESQDPIKITANPSSIGQGESCDVFLTYGSGDNTINVTGNLKQVVHTGNTMSEVVLRPNSYKRCFPITWIKNETRPSGIKMIGDSVNGTSLGFSGTPTSDDTINIPQLINKFVVSLPTDLSTKHYNWDSSVQEADKYFLNNMRVTVTADEGYKFPTNMEYSNVTITPTTMTQYLTMTRLSDNKLQFSLKDKVELDLTKLSDVQIDIPACERSTYRVEITLGTEMRIMNGYVDRIQNVIIGQSMEQINLLATNDYCFFPSIHNKSKDGITINVDTSEGPPYFVAWISGTPLRDVQLTVPNAVKGAKLDVVLPSDGSVLAKAGEEVRLNQFIESGEYIDGVTLVPKDTNYKMTQDWRKTITVEPANDHIMMMTSDVETYISGKINENTVIDIPALSLAFSPNVKHGALLIMAPLTGTPVGESAIRIKAPKILNGTYGDFNFNNSDTVTCGAMYSERFALYDAPPGEYTVTFTYEMSFDTKFTLTGNNSVIIDDSNRGSIVETSMIYNLVDIAFGYNNTDFVIQASGTVSESIAFTTTSTLMRPDFPNESDIAAAQYFIDDLQTFFGLNDQNINLQISADLPYLVYSGGANLKSFVLIDVQSSRRIRKVEFVPYG